MKKMVQNLIFISIGLLICVVYLRYIEQRSIYFPMKGIEVTPLEFGLEYEDIYFDAQDGVKLNGWYVPAKGATKLVIFCHGNAGNISHRMEKISIFNRMGLDVFIFDYRGYGLSKGRPSEDGLYADIRGAYSYIKDIGTIPSKDHIMLYGESLGAVPVVDLAKDLPVDALIIESAFTSTKDLVSIYYPFIPHFVFATKFASDSKIGKIDCPKLIIHSINDEIVPYRLGRRLYDLANPPKEFLQLKGGHNTSFLDSEEAFRSGIRSFIAKL